MTTEAPRLSRIRTLLFGALALVWFSEMVLWGFQSLSRSWVNVWHISPLADPRLAAALYVTLAAEAPAKGALGVMAVFGLRSKSPSARTALFLSMALVPPLNLAFQFREQGFPLRSTVVAALFSLVLWVPFFLFRERDRQAELRSPPSRWEILQYAWFAIYSSVLTLMAVLFLFARPAVLSLIFPCTSDVLRTFEGGLSGLSLACATNGAHLVALATASWIATLNWRRNPALRRALTIASTVHAGLFLVFPLRQMLMEFGRACVTSSILVAFVPLFVGWVLYAAASLRRRTPELAGEPAA